MYYCYGSFHDPNGNGYTLKVDINDTDQRSVFPYVYGVICNLKIEGSISSQASAQPVRTLYGSIVNCIFELDLSADNANGILYSNYNLVYNVYTCGTLLGSSVNPVASNDTSTNYVNVFYSYTSNGSAVNDDHGSYADDIGNVVSAFNNRTGTEYNNALAELGGMPMLDVAVENGSLVFVNKNIVESVSDNKETASGASELWILLIAIAVVAIVVTAAVIIKKR